MKNIVILTGAGISADSGVSTFRDPDGIWAKYDFRDLATPEAFARHPELVHEFYNARRAQLEEVEPNAGHRALAALEKALAQAGGTLTLVTQNVDDLHERGGSENVIHMHGELRKVRCGDCGAVQHWLADLDFETQCPACQVIGHMRPHIVWFGEMPMEMDLIGQHLMEADLFVSIGTSGSVYPAAGFVAEARAANIKCIEINLEPSDNAFMFDEKRYGPGAVEVPKWVEEMIASFETLPSGSSSG